MDIIFNNRDRDEFFEKIVNEIKDYLPEDYEDASVALRQVTKNNDTVMNALIVKLPEENITPSIYLDDLYKQHLEGREDDEIIKSIANTIRDAQVPTEIELDDILDYEDVKDKLMIHICDKERNSMLLQSLPHSIEGDFAAIYRVIMSHDEEGIQSVLVNNSLMDIWKVNEEQLHKDALVSSYSNQYVFRTMEDIMYEILDPFADRDIVNILDLDPEEAPKAEMYVLTNEMKYYGAAGIANNELMKNIGELINSDYYVLPSSIHETIIVPKQEGMNAEHFINMVQEVNFEEVSDTDILSDKVQFFDREIGVLQNAWDYEHPIEAQMRKSKPINRGKDKGIDFGR